MLMNLPWSDLVIIFSSIAIAYIIFGIAGFGTALIASPVLANFIPISYIVPLLALMDLFAALSNIVKDGKKADILELKRLIPLMILGSLIGAAILLKTNAEILLLALSIFVIGYSLYSLSGFKPNTKFNSNAAIPFGMTGGVFSALFGSGGFIYAIYLSGRIENKENMRITQSTLIGFSTLTRVILFSIAGVYANGSILILALILSPAMLIGIFIGRNITLKLTREQFLRIINLIVLLSG
ncbi:sulfite exporter TauE/SafE family protein, partial [Avibacterium avium]|uniref:sulfite exporter TauE/SafE family protein n=3 Tax=Pasteurellaceae TaxID=712 RepID=UPI003BF8C211